jgi:hypothetical protein
MTVMISGKAWTADDWIWNETAISNDRAMDIMEDLVRAVQLERRELLMSDITDETFEANRIEERDDDRYSATLSS